MRPPHIVAPYRILRRNSSLPWLLAGQGLSSLADWLLAVVLTVLVYNISHSETMVSFLTFARLSPYALVLPWSGFLLDRTDKRLLATGLGLGRAACMLGLLLVQSRVTLPLVFPLVFVSSSLSCVLRPVVNATIPALVSDSDVIAANSLVTQSDGAAHIAGPAIAAGFVVIHQPQLALLVTGAAFLVSGAAFFRVGIPGSGRVTTTLGNRGPGEVLAGFRYLWRENQGVMIALAAVAAGVGLLAGAYYVLALALSTRTFHLGGQGVGWLDALYGVGGLAGSLLVPALVRGRRIAHLFIAGAGVSSLGVLFLALSPPGLAPFTFMVVVGAAGVVVQVTATSILQSAAPRDMLGRTFTAFEASLVAALLIGALSAGPLVRLAGPRGATGLFALAGMALVIAALPRLSRLEDVLGLRVFLRGVPILAGLSRPLLDELAPRFQSVTAQAGEPIVSEGEPGDRLFIVRHGEVEVSVGGRVVRKLGPARYFGEVSLLHDIPRTASVRACAYTALYCLDKDSFHEILRRADQVGNRFARNVENYDFDGSVSPVLRH